MKKFSDADLLVFCHLFNRWNKRIGLARKGMPLAEEWRGWPLGFICFAQWSLKNGFSSDKVIDRIDGKKGYSPNNCRWVSCKENVWNSVSSTVVIHKGKEYPAIKELWRKLAKNKMDYATFKARLYVGWSPEEAVRLKVNHGNGWKRGTRKK